MMYKKAMKVHQVTDDKLVVTFIRYDRDYLGQELIQHYDLPLTMSRRMANRALELMDDGYVCRPMFGKGVGYIVAKERSDE